MAMLSASNVDVINTIRANASLAYRDRIPVATQSTLATTLQRIQEFDPFWNEFQSILINKIGLVVMDKNMVFENRLRPLKSGALEYGGMVQELDAQLLEAQSYDPNATNVFDAEPPEVLANYHKINRRDKYKFKVNSDLLEEAFLNEGQLSAYVNSLMVLPQQSAEWDEYKLMLQLLSEYQRVGDGFANYQVSSVSDETTGKALTRVMREYYLKMKGFYQNSFNKSQADAFSTDLVLITTPRTQSYLDVDVLANAFNMDKAEWLSDRLVIVDEWPEGLDGTQAMLLDRDFYRVWDAKRRNVSIFNPDTLDWIYTYHIWQILSVSTVKNALRFSTARDNLIIPPTRKVPSSVTLTVAGSRSYFQPGDEIQLGATVTYDDSSTDGNAYFVISAATGTAGAYTVVTPDTGTYLDRYGVLHIAKDAQWSQLKVQAFATEKPSVASSETTLNAASLTLSAYTAAVSTASSTASITATTVPSSATITATSSDTSKATVAVNNKTITVTKVAAGTCTVTVKSVINGIEYTKDIAVTVS